MKRASWSGNFRLGNLVLPVKLYAATQSVAPEFVQVHKDDLQPVQRKMVYSKNGKAIDSKEIIKAVEHDGKYIAVPDSGMPEPHVGRDIIVRQFADIGQISTFYYDKPYYLVPATGGEMAYTTLRNALKKADKIAIVTYSLYGRAHIGIIHSAERIMVLHQLKYAAEIVDSRDIKMPSLPQPAPDQVDLAVRLIEKYSTAFYIDDYRNEQLDALHELVERAIKGLQPPKAKRASSDATPVETISKELKGLLDKGESTLPT